jgi:hypothetical protein
MKPGWQPRNWLAKKAKAGNRGFPIGTVAFYGPDDRRASKVAVGVIVVEGAEPILRRWFSETGDVREDEAVGREMAMFLRSQGVHSIAMTDKIIGCPHEEGIDYPEGEDCPKCPFWKGRDRWAASSQG